MCKGVGVLSNPARRVGVIQSGSGRPVLARRLVNSSAAVAVDGLKDQGSASCGLSRSAYPADGPMQLVQGLIDYDQFCGVAPSGPPQMWSLSGR